MNSTVSKVLNLPENKVTILPSVACEEVGYYDQFPKANFNVLSVGRFVALKGFDVTIRAFAAFYKTLLQEEQKKVSLTLVGRGPAEALLRKIIEEEEIEQAVSIIPWIEREKLSLIYEGADLFFFPSHEGAGMVVSEAMSYGLPILCFDNCGPGAFINTSCGRAIPYQDYDKNIEFFKEDLQRLYEDRNLLDRLSSGARRQHKNRFTWNLKGEIFRTVYESILTNSKPVNNEADKTNYIRTPVE